MYIYIYKYVRVFVDHIYAQITWKWVTGYNLEVMEINTEISRKELEFLMVGTL